jgi:hypothetical protein
MFTIYSAVLYTSNARYTLYTARHFKKLCIPVIVNVKNSLKQCNGCDNTEWTVNSEVNLSMYRDDGRVTAETCVG